MSKKIDQASHLEPLSSNFSNLDKLDELDKLLRKYYANPEFGDKGEKQEAILDALQTIYGKERGSLDYVGYAISGDCRYSIEDAIEFIKDELDLEQDDAQPTAANTAGQGR